MGSEINETAIKEANYEMLSKRQKIVVFTKNGFCCLPSIFSLSFTLFSHYNESICPCKSILQQVVKIVKKYVIQKQLPRDLAS